MCGIIALFNHHPKILEAFKTLKSRGPDNSKLVKYNDFFFWISKTSY